MSAPGKSVPGDAARALAEADFSAIVDGFGGAGFTLRQPARGILQMTAPSQASQRLRLLLSVGIHGDETAPIEMLAHLLSDLAREPHALALDLMVVVGNPDAIAQGKRFVDADLNRLFCTGRGALQSAAEAARAELIMQAGAAFFASARGEKWHLDLHTAIRPSLYPTFAVIPDVIADAGKRALIAWLGGAGIGAAILNAQPAPTFSAYSASQFGATSCTAELGQVGALGQNDLSALALTQAALAALLRSGDTLAFRHRPPQVFQVAQEIVKQSEHFRMAFDRHTQNFTPLAPGAVIAHDGATVHRVGPVTEYVVFPNPEVRVGQRAGLMVVRRE